MKSGADFWTGCSSQPYGLRFSDDSRIICYPFVAAEGGIPDLWLCIGCANYPKHLTRVCHKYSNAPVICIKWDQYPWTHGDDKQITLRPHSSLWCPTSCSSHNAAQLLHTIPASGCVQTNRHINTLGDVPKQLHHVSLDRTAVRLKGSPSGVGCIREIRRGRPLWRADLFNHVRHSGLSFCPFYYDILAPSSPLSCHSLPSRRAPPLCRILARVLILMRRDTQEWHTISRGRAVQIALWAYFGEGKRNNITWAAEAQFKMKQPFSSLLFAHIVPLYITRLVSVKGSANLLSLNIAVCRWGVFAARPAVPKCVLTS